MFPNLAVSKFIHLAHQAVEKFTVVAHYDGSAVEGIDGLF